MARRFMTVSPSSVVWDLAGSVAQHAWPGNNRVGSMPPFSTAAPVPSSPVQNRFGMVTGIFSLRTRRPTMLKRILGLARKAAHVAGSLLAAVFTEGASTHVIGAGKAAKRTARAPDRETPRRS